MIPENLVSFYGQEVKQYQAVGRREGTERVLHCMLFNTGFVMNPVNILPTQKKRDRKTVKYYSCWHLVHAAFYRAHALSTV